MKCSNCSTEKSPQSDTCLNCGGSDWVGQESNDAFDQQSLAFFGFDQPAPVESESTQEHGPSRITFVLRWLGVAVASALVTVFGMTYFMHGFPFQDQPIASPSASGLPAWAHAFSQQEINKGLAYNCSDLQAAVYAAPTIDDLNSRLASAQAALAAPASSKTYIQTHPWVKQANPIDGWLAGIESADSTALARLAAASVNATIKSTSVATRKQHYLTPLQNTWLAVCGISGTYADKFAALNDYATIKTQLASSAASATAEPSPSSSPAASQAGQGGDNGGSKATGAWPPSGFKAVAGFAGFVYKPVNNYCQVGTVCAKFKVSAKASCAAGASLNVQFLDASGKIVDSYAGLADLRNGQIALVEADTAAASVSGWQISNISCN